MRKIRTDGGRVAWCLGLVFALLVFTFAWLGAGASTWLWGPPMSPAGWENSASAQPPQFPVPATSRLAQQQNRQGQPGTAAQASPMDGVQAQKNGNLIAFSITLKDGRQQITLIDTNERSMSVYHLDPVRGEVSLKSVRNFHWDLKMEEFNGTKPTPREIRALIERR